MTPLLESLAERFAGDGYSGEQLMERVFAAGWILAALVGDKQSEDYCNKRFEQVTTKPEPWKAPSWKGKIL